MPSVKINRELNSGWYFITFTTVHWYYLFDRHNRWNILANCLTYCANNKDLTLYSFVFMLNHVHLICSSPDMAGFVRDFKKFTTRELKKNIETTEPNVLKLFFDEEGKYQFWQGTNMPLPIVTEEFLLQKMQYIHLNPVRKQYVAKPEHWYWSSANPRCVLKVSHKCLF